MSFLSRLFGGSAKEPEPTVAKVTGQVEHKGYLIKAVPYKQEGQFQTAGTIEKEIGGVLKSYRFVRADRSAMVEEVTDLALRKGQAIIDEQGDSIFAD